MKEEKNSAVLKTAEISQSEERLKQQLRSESHEISELYETIQSIQVSLQTKTYEVERLTEQRQELQTKLNDFHKRIDSIDDLKNEIMDKNKVRISGIYRIFEMFSIEFYLFIFLQSIKMLNQRLVDMKKTLQHELKTNGSAKSMTSQSNGNLITECHGSKSNGIGSEQTTDNSLQKSSPAVMDDVNFRYLKHVIFKFLTSREVTKTATNPIYPFENSKKKILFHSTWSRSKHDI